MLKSKLECYSSPGDGRNRRAFLRQTWLGRSGGLAAPIALAILLILASYLLLVVTAAMPLMVITSVFLLHGALATTVPLRTASTRLSA